MDPIGHLGPLYRRARFLIAILALTPGAALGQAGYVHALSGEATLQDARGGRAAKAGDTFLQGTTFRTAGNGRLIVKFEDGQLVALQPNTTFRVDRYRYDPRNPRSSSSAISMSAGALRFVTGVIGATDERTIEVATGVLRVFRGTDVTLVAGAESAPGQAVAVNAGLAYVQTMPGTISDNYSPYSTLSVIVGVGQFTTAQAGRPPLLAGPIESAPAAVQAAINSLAAAALPSNQPVVVAAAARAAAVADTARRAAAAAAANPTNASLRILAEAAQLDARNAAATARNQSTLALDMAIRAGYVAPAAPASSEKVQAASARVPPEPTLRFLGCTGSPC